MQHENTPDGKAKFSGVDRVVDDPLRFKLRLGIGEDAYAALRLKKNLQELWDTGGMAATGATVAMSPVVATTFFAPTGFLALIGIGTAVTPIGWVAAAAMGSAGAYYGVTRLYGRFAGSRVDIIPKFINTPLDLLAATLIDLVGALAVRIAQIDGVIDDKEIGTISEYFITEWGYDPTYVRKAIAVLVDNAGLVGVKEIAVELAAFHHGNPDCNPSAMRRELLAFLRDVMAADGVLDEREQLAIDAIAAVMDEAANPFSKARKRVAALTGNVAARLNAATGRGSDPAPKKSAP